MPPLSVPSPSLRPAPPGCLRDPSWPADGAAVGLDEILGVLRRLALAALDGGHPVAAARIAGTADRLEAEALPPWQPPSCDAPPAPA